MIRQLRLRPRDKSANRSSGLVSAVAARKSKLCPPSRLPAHPNANPVFQSPQCNGVQPCSRCASVRTTCVYGPRTGEEEVRQIQERRIDDLAREGDDFRTLFRLLAEGSDAEAHAVLHQMRSGAQLDTLVRGIREDGGDGVPPPVRRARRQILTAMAQSTAALLPLVESGQRVLAAADELARSRATLLWSLQDQIVTLEILDTVVRDSLLTSPEHQSLMARAWVDSSHTGPDLWVPALPWSPLQRDDAAVSHLVSLFLAYVNPFYRFLEEDVFVAAMRRQSTRNDLCSSLLIYSVLAAASVRKITASTYARGGKTYHRWAQLYSEKIEAFSSPYDLLTRGEHFHDEAIRLWELDDQRPSIASTQALLILAYE